MKIGIDLHSMTHFMQGSRTYIYNLVSELLKIDHNNEYFLYYTSKSAQVRSCFTNQNAYWKNISPHQRFIRIAFSFPVRLSIDAIDIFHCQYMGPMFSSTPYVVSMHDIIHEYMPDLYPTSLRLLMSLFYPISARRAAQVLTLSESSKRDLMKHYNLSEERITVIHPGVSDLFRPLNKDATLFSILKRYHIPKDYILYVGRLEPRKNLPLLINAFHFLKKKVSIPHKLILAGMRYYRYEEILRTIDRLKLKDEVILPGRVEDKDLPYLYNGATLFVYPSLAEGFGLPPLEAMACGTPTVVSQTSSLPEVVGDAGLLIDPLDPKNLADVMLEVLADRNMREDMRAKGLARAKSFSWENTARQTLAAYRKAYEKSRLHG